MRKRWTAAGTLQALAAVPTDHRRRRPRQALDRDRATTPHPIESQNTPQRPEVTATLTDLCLLVAQPTLVNVCARTVLRPMQLSGLTALNVSLFPAGLIL